MGCVYIAINMINSKSYVGKTKRNFESRWYEHKIYSRSESNYPFHNALKKYGEKNFFISIVKYSDSTEELNDLEKMWISILSSNNSNYGYNITRGGDGGNSCISTVWVNNGKVSKMLRVSFPVPEGWSKGRLPCGCGNKRGSFHHSEATRKKMGLTRKGRSLASVTRQRQLESVTGTVWVTNGRENKHFRKETPLPVGWRYGLTKKATNEKIQEIHDNEG